jgi:hypothetical protein
MPPTPSGGARTRRAAAAAEQAATPATRRRGNTANANGAGASAGPWLLPSLRLCARALVLAWLVIVWLWHLTPAASVLPGATGHLWFFRYLTFYSFSLQLLAVALAVAHETSALFSSSSAAAAKPPAKSSARGARKPTLRHRLALWADDLGCAVFCFAHVVTLMFHLIQRAQGRERAVEGAHIERPPWLDASVHRLNAAAAWMDIALLAPRGGRSFSASGERLSQVLVAFYCSLLAASKALNGAFPYPFMNAMRHPHGYAATCGFGLVIFGVAFKVGRVVGGGLRRAEDWAADRVREGGGGDDGDGKRGEKEK